jgi:hypothetical protein
MKSLNIKGLKIENDEEYWLLGYDQSGSTGSYNGDYFGGNKVRFYHLKTQQIEATLLEGKNVKRIGWDNTIHEHTKMELKKINDNLTGFGGTDPQVLLNYIKEKNFHGNLVLITDGAVHSTMAQKCSELLKEWKFEKVFVFLIDTGSGMEESISCGFVRNSPHVIEVYNSDGSLKQGVVDITPESFALLDRIDAISTQEEFEQAIPILDNLLMSINMGNSGNTQVKDKLVRLKNSLIRNKSNKREDKVVNLIECPNLDNLRSVWNLYFYGSSDVKIFEKTLDKYISWCSGALASTFNRNQINRDSTAKVSPPPAPEIVELIETTPANGTLFECPITLDGSRNVMILFKKRDSLFRSLGDDKNLKDALTNCPMNALCNPEVLEYMKGFLDRAISFEAYKQLIDHGMSDESPLTRDEIIGGICLGYHDSHVKFSNSVMRIAFTGGKCHGNVDLWFAVIYLMVAKGLVPHLNDELPFLEEQMTYRLRNSTTYMCLSGLPTYPTYRVPLNIALWSILSASAVTTEPKEEPLRLHLPYATEIVDLVNLSGLTLPSGINEYVNRLESLRCILNRKKKCCKEIVGVIKALKFNFIQLSDETFIYIDGMPTEEHERIARLKLPAFFENLSREEIIHIESICDTQKKESEINYNISTKPTGVVIGAKNWHYPETVPYRKVDICFKTCRPYYRIGNGTWKDKAKEIYGNIQLMSMNKLFGNRVCKIGRYPEKEEFLKYVSEYFSRKEGAGKAETLPICVNQFLNELYDEYDEIIRTVRPEDFVSRWKESAEIEKRVQMERI